MFLRYSPIYIDVMCTLGDPCPGPSAPIQNVRKKTSGQYSGLLDPKATSTEHRTGMISPTEDGKQNVFSLFSGLVQDVEIRNVH